MCVSERVWSKAKASWDARTEELIKCSSTAIADAERRWGPPEGHWSPVHLRGIDPNTVQKRISAGEKPLLVGMVTCDWTQLPPLRVFPQIPHGSFSLFHLILSSQWWLKLREWPHPFLHPPHTPALGYGKNRNKRSLPPCLLILACVPSPACPSQPLSQCRRLPGWGEDFSWVCSRNKWSMGGA